METEASSAAPSPDDSTSLAVRRAIRGDMGSLSWLVTRLSPLLRLQANYRLKDGLRTLCDPEDLVQDAWLTALPRLRELEPVEGRYTPALLRFLGTIVLYKVSNLARRHARSPLVARSEEDRALLADSEQTGVVSAAVRQELRGAVSEALQDLDEMDREILVLRGIEQHRNQFVAQLLGLTPQGVSMRFARALERLRKRLPSSIFDELQASPETPPPESSSEG